MLSATRFLTLSAALAALSGCPGEGPPPPGVTLPEPDQGWQFEVAEFDVPAGHEIQNCYFVEVPEDEEVCVARIEVAQEPGTHHMNVFRLGTQIDLWGEAGDVVYGDSEDRTTPCWRSGNWADWPLVVNSQQSDEGGHYDWTMPDGVVHHFAPGEVLMIQSHYVNGSTQVGEVGHVFVNFHTVPCDGTQELGTMFATNQGIDICPGDLGIEFSSSCGNGFTDPVTVIAANSHYHSRGRNFTIEPYDPIAGEYGEPFYENESWDDPLMATDLDVTITPDQRIGWHCSYDYAPPAGGTTCEDLDAINASKEPTCCYGFGGIVDASEHCNIFVYYYPKVEDFSCI